MSASSSANDVKRAIMLTEEISFDPARVPAHVAIIMDGNGRWAQARGLERSAGHVEGVNTVRRITEAASKAGVKYLTLYTFSTENWHRPQHEVDLLMDLIVTAIERETPDLIKNNVRLTAIGDLDRLPDCSRARLEACFRDTGACTGLTLVLALSYSSRWEITRAMVQIAADVRDGLLDVSEINQDTVAAHLSTSSFPDPDLLIRTGGEKRLSNFLLYQSAYTELVLSDIYWPDYTEKDFYSHIAEYQRRQRRFGRTGDQVTQQN